MFRTKGLKPTNRTGLVIPVLTATVLCGVGCAETSPPAEDTSAASAGSAQRIAQSAQTMGMRPGLNPLQHEMVLLDGAMREVITLLSYNAVAAIPATFHPVHVARDSTVAFMARGEYRLPRNPEAMAEFEMQDASFHQLLDALSAAASVGDLARATTETGSVLDSCTRCHLRFRF